MAIRIYDDVDLIYNKKLALYITSFDDLLLWSILKKEIWWQIQVLEIIPS